MQKVFLRADGNSEIGLGHVSRLTALSEMLAGSFHTCFLLKEYSTTLSKQIAETANEVKSIPGFDTYKEEACYLSNNVLYKDDILVTDGYDYDTLYQTEIKKSGCKLVCIDDFAPYHFVADVVINHAVDSISYSKEAYTKLFAGTDYVLLKKTYLSKAQQEMKIGLQNNSLLVCLGGADPQNITMQAVKKLQEEISDKHINIVIGAANKNLDTLKQEFNGDDKISLLINLNANELSTLMENASTAVTSASTIALEYICIKGDLFLIQTADNQLHLYNSLIDKKCALPFAEFTDKTALEKIIANQHQLIDGKSTNRIIEIFKTLSLN